MIPKFVGNASLRTIDFRYTGIEGGRPKDPAGSGLSGRRYVMWDDTFEDAQSITSIRIRSDNLGRNIGIFNMPQINILKQGSKVQHLLYHC